MLDSNTNKQFRSNFIAYQTAVQHFILFFFVRQDVQLSQAGNNGIRTRQVSRRRYHGDKRFHGYGEQGFLPERVPTSHGGPQGKP